MINAMNYSHIWTPIIFVAVVGTMQARQIPEIWRGLLFMRGVLHALQAIHMVAFTISCLYIADNLLIEIKILEERVVSGQRMRNAWKIVLYCMGLLWYSGCAIVLWHFSLL